MDFNEFSFEALFRCPDFKSWDSPELIAADKEFFKLLKSRITDHSIYIEIECASNEHCAIVQESGFEQGFRFAVKLMKKLYDMSFPDVPPTVIL